MTTSLTIVSLTRAALESGFVGEMPKLGDRISVQVSEGYAWMFCRHRTLAVTTSEKYWAGRAEGESYMDAVSRPILTWLQNHLTVNSDDVFEQILNAAEGRDHRIVGCAFNYLIRKKKIHAITPHHSSRPRRHRGMCWTYELTLPKES